MLMTSKLHRIVWSFTLIATFAIVVSNTIFIHTHILPDGRVIEHAHPYKSTGKNSDSQPNHHHTSQEFFLLSHIYHLFSKTNVFFIVIIFFNRTCCQYILFELKTSYSLSYRRIKSPRAPPQLLFSL